MEGGTSSMQASVLNMVINCMGVGVLSSAWCFSRSSIVVGVLLAVVCSMLSVVSFVALAQACEATQKFTYLEVGKQLLGKRGGLGIQVTVFLHTFLSTIAYVVFFADLMPQGLSHLFDNISLNIELGKDFSVLVVSIAAVVLFTPLSLLRTLEMLKYTSFLAGFAFVFIIFVVVFQLATQKSSHVKACNTGFPQVDTLKYSPCLLDAFPVIAMAFCAHFNGPDYYKELKNRSVRRFGIVSFSSLTIVLAAFLLIGTTGYMTCGNEVEQVLLNSYNQGNNLVIAAELLFGIVVAFTLPFIMFQCKVSFFAIFMPSIDPNSWKGRAITTIILAVSVVVGIILKKKVTVVIGFIGCITGSCIVFIFPALLALNIPQLSKKGSAVNTSVPSAASDLLNTPSSTSSARGLFPSFDSPSSSFNKPLLAGSAQVGTPEQSIEHTRSRPQDSHRVCRCGQENVHAWILLVFGLVLSVVGLAFQILINIADQFTYCSA